MPKNIRISLQDDEAVDKISAALNSDVRRKMLGLVSNEQCSIMDISSRLNLPISTTSFHIKILNEAGLITLSQNTATRGKEKIVARGVNNINIDFSPRENSASKIETFNIPLGTYTDFRVEPSCGMATQNGIVIKDDMPSAFYLPERILANLVWFSKGYLEYSVANYMFTDQVLDSIGISCEICSECPNFSLDWKSDITFWINGVEVCTWESPGDMGGRRGVYSPTNWSMLASQFGFLKSIVVNRDGTFLEQQRVSSVNISKLNLMSGDCIKIRIGIKDDAKHCGGINIFGKHFGDYAQNIVVKVEYHEQ